MEEIVLLLGNTDLSIHRIMEQCGLSNETYFYKRFRALYGISPNEYRKTIRRSGKEHNK
jgi:AraC-like DNA-binding protein